MDTISKIFNFNGSGVTFKNENGTIMVDAVEMAKPFGKRPVDWLRTQGSNEFIEALTRVKKFTSADLVIVTKGGNSKTERGTWMHEDVAIEFARWLSPVFAIWCNDRIKELITTGQTSLNIPKTYQEALRALADEVDKREKAEQLALESEKVAKQEKAEKEMAIKTLEEKQPEIDFANSFEKVSEGSMLVREAAKRLTQNGIIIGDKNLRLLLQEWNFFTKSNGYELNANVIKKGYAEYRYSCGYNYENNTVYITQKGFKSIVQNIINPKYRNKFLKYGYFTSELKNKLGITC